MELSFWTMWEWLVTATGAVLLVLLFGTRMLQADKSISRWRDVTWFAWLAAACLMVHITEEYGIDFAGRTFAFPAMMEDMIQNALVGADAVLPPIEMLPVVNMTMAWFSLPMAAILARKHPLALTGAVGLLGINSLAHIIPGILMQSYNPGMVTGIALFIPLVVWYLYAFYGKDSKSGLKRSYGWLVLVNGVVAMGILAAAIFNYAFGNISVQALMAAHVINAVILAFLPLLEEKLLKVEALPGVD